MAKVVCRTVKGGSGGGTVYNGPDHSYHGNRNETSPKGDIFLDDVVCTGKESSIFECPHRAIREHNCGHHEDVAILCN